MGFGEYFHMFEGICLDEFRVVWHYSCDADALTLHCLDIDHQPRNYSLYVGAVVADEHQEGAIRAANCIQVIASAVDAEERDSWRFPAKITYGCVHKCHFSCHSFKHLFSIAFLDRPENQ